ncbi:hypothetical protein B0A48_05607 [Cryoendolithus antarcticus]|uniref:Major facilitator superfamily (MFS) profile domain-containing protein n=1 Tax=Cryoendolithus antarcticus TaxID=1507870 RepID=A0A1V8TJC7_9PEZI|nr:hypothetical protein B0A48_05607 [Cryoendolithus antarcticus]
MSTVTTTTEHELQENRRQISIDEHDSASTIPLEPTEASPGHSPPRADGGKEAWRVLIVAFVFEALLWGFPLSFGVFQQYYSRLPEFQDSAFISVIGTLASGLSYLAAPVMISVVRRFARYRELMIWVGWPICILSLLASSFATTLGGLVATQGVLYGLGFITFYYPILSILNEYWIARRGLAYGIMCSASGLAGTVFPSAIETSLRRYGYPTTLRAIAVGLCILTGPLIPFLRPRVPVSAATAPSRTDWSFLHSPTFWLYSLSNLAMGLGYFFPSLYIPSYATANGMTPLLGALLLTLMSIAQVLGQLTFGYLSDQPRIPLPILAGSSMLISSLAVYTAWGLAHTFPVLAAFALNFGFFGAGYTALWGRMGMAVSSEPSAAFAAFGLLNVGKGIGNLAAGPLSGALLRKGVEAGGYGVGRFGAVVLFSGTCLAVSAAVLPLGLVKKFRSRRVR